MRRWTFRFVILLLVLALLGAVAVQVVLGTDVPRKMVLTQVERALGLRVTAAALETGWTGHTTLRDVTLSLPLAGESFLTVKSLRVRHTVLPAILAGREVRISAIEFDEPQLLVQQDAAGRWNVADVADLLRRAAGGEQAKQSAAAEQKPHAIQIPAIAIHDGTLRIIDNRSRTALVQPVSVRGEPDGPLVWKYDASAGGSADSPSLHLVGKLAPGGSWKHEVDLSLSDLEPRIGPWLADEGSASLRQYVTTAKLRASWVGEVAEPSGALTGRLTIDELTAGTLKATGAVSASFENGVLHLRPSGLTVAGPPATPSDIKVAGGELLLHGTQIQTASPLVATISGGDVRVSGNFDWRLGSAQAQAQWHNVVVPAAQTVHDGSLTLEMRNNFPDIRHVAATIASSATGPRYGWDGRLTLEGSGRTLAQVNWQATAEKLRLTREKFTANLDGLAARMVKDPSGITLTELTVPAGELAPGRPRGTLNGSGYYHFPDRKHAAGGDWWLVIDGDQWRISDAASIKTNFTLDASGDLDAPGKQNWARINEFYAATSTGWQLWAGGAGLAYDAVGMPLNHFSVFTWYPPFTLNAYDAGELLRGGRFASTLDVDGGLWPMALNIRGELHGKDVYLHGKRIGDMAMELHGRSLAKRDDPLDYDVTLQTSKLHLLEGTWDVSARYSSANDTADVVLTLSELPLEKLDTLISSPKLAGSASGKWNVHAQHLDFQRAKIDSVQPLMIERFSAGQFGADTLAAELHAEEGNVRITGLKLRKAGGGQIDASAEFRLKEPWRMKLTATASAWPLDLPPRESLLLYGQASDMAVDLRSASAVGPLKLDVYARHDQVDLGVLRTEGRVDHHTISLTKIAGEGNLGGTTQGTASYDFDDVLKARADLQLTGVQSEALLRLFPEVKGLHGSISGTLRVGPPLEPRPLGPLQFTAAVSMEDGGWRAIAVKSANLSAFYDPGTATSAPTGDRETRFVLGNSVISMAGGDVRLFARATRHPGAAESGARVPWSSNVTIDAARLDLNQVTHAADPEARDTPGRLDLRFTLIGDPRDPQTHTGVGSATLTDTDLGQNSIISALYGIMSIKPSNSPTGSGSATFRLTGSALDITSFRYFNRGIEVRGVGQLTDLWLGGDSGVNAYVLGSVRPFKDLKLPFIVDLDKVLNVIQQGSNPARITGTLKHPKVDPALFADIGQGLRSLILGDVTSETRSTAGQ
jgi:hypothetical protein